ncbi:serine palmitoyltransferase small subunit A-like [Babylonia areolata]|uniref:serine palmitoyltransferase small subunit A-like n=1 Tax=Babylonia areolata TaxID=304850 RepID=UPI003FD5AE37
MIPGFGLMKRAWMFIRWCYFQFAIHTCVSMLEPVEERVLISLLVAMVLMVSYVTITYLPGHLIMLFSFTRYILGV